MSLHMLHVPGHRQAVSRPSARRSSRRVVVAAARSGDDERELPLVRLRQVVVGASVSLAIFLVRTGKFVFYPDSPRHSVKRMERWQDDGVLLQSAASGSDAEDCRASFLSSPPRSPFSSQASSDVAHASAGLLGAVEQASGYVHERFIVPCRATCRSHCNCHTDSACGAVNRDIPVRCQYCTAIWANESPRSIVLP